MIGAGALLLLALTGAPAPAGAPRAAPAPHRYVVVIGHNGGGADKERASLRFADDDAARFFRQVLPTARQAWLLTTFDAETARLYPTLSDLARPPSRRELARVLGEVNWAVNEEKDSGTPTELIFFFAGHGDVDVDGQGFLVFEDGRFTRSELERQVVRGSNADLNHVIIDACASYFMVGRGGGKQSGAVTLSPGVLDAAAGPSPDLAPYRARTGVLVSTSDASEVHESSQLGGGVFSYLLRSALSGAADVNGDGQVEYAEVAAFVASASQAIDDPRARLKVHATPPAQRPHVALTDLAGGGAEHFLRVDRALATHVRVLDEDGLPYAEVNRTDGGPVTLALSGSRFYVVQMGDREAVLVPRRAGAYSLSTLEFDESPAPRSAEVGPFAPLFSRPFDRTFVDGFVASAALPPPRTGPVFQPAWAPGYEPPTPFPWRWVGVGLLSGAAGFGVLAAGAVIGNVVAFGMLYTANQQTGLIDPNLQLAVEGFRLGAVGAGLFSLALVGAGSGMVAWDVWLREEEEP